MTSDLTFYFQQQGGGFYLIPDELELPPGELDLRSLSGKQQRVDPEAVRPYAVDKATAHAHLKTQLYAKLGRVGESLNEAWRRGRERK